ncbi:MAG: hypothetical protein JNJ75_06285 [Cyclobacteriaceae bacterium]|nr:hypothetical protein [Cyclobacteriaceae bacterium]
MKEIPKLPMTDLEEDILFLLTRQCGALSVIRMTDLLAKNSGMSIPLADIHRTLLQLERVNFIEVSLVKLKRHYRITKEGLEALQHDWNYHREHLHNHAEA